MMKKGKEPKRERAVEAAPNTERGFRLLMEKDIYRDLNGAVRPPAQIPRAGEIAMGVYYDPEWNTH